MIPKLPNLDVPHLDDLLDQHLKFNGGMTSDNLRRSLPQRLLQAALAAPPQADKPQPPAQPPQPAEDQPKR